MLEALEDQFKRTRGKQGVERRSPRSAAPESASSSSPEPIPSAVREVLKARDEYVDRVSREQDIFPDRPLYSYQNAVILENYGHLDDAVARAKRVYAQECRRSEWGHRAWVFLLGVARFRGDRAGEQELVELGFSRRKAEYVLALARSDIDLNGLAALDDEDVKARVASFRGLGEWTADWFLARHLARPRAWPAGDLGLRKAASAFYGDGRELSTEEVRAFGDNIARWGTPVLLIETGRIGGNAPEPALVRVNFVALGTALDALASAFREVVAAR